jgi:phage baseplate assembly protein gpV
MSSPVSNEPAEAPVQQAGSSSGTSRGAAARRRSAGEQGTSRDAGTSGQPTGPAEQALTPQAIASGDSGTPRGTPTGQSGGGEDITLVGAMRRIAESETRKVRTFDLGIVTSIFPHESESDDQNYYCSVRLRDSDSEELRNVPILTRHIGMVHVPNVGDLVMIGYIGGNVNSPVVMGSLYNDEQRPPVNKAGEIVYESPDSEDSSGDIRRVYLKTPSGIEVKIGDKTVSVHIEKSDTALVMKDTGEVWFGTEGKCTIWYDPQARQFVVTGYGDYTFFSGKDKTTLESREGALEVKAAQNMTIQCGGDLTIKAANIKLESTANTDVKAGVNATVSGKAVTTVEGKVVKIN